MKKTVTKTTLKTPEVISSKVEETQATTLIEGSFISKKNEVIVLNDFLQEGDWYELKKRKSKVVILTHRAVEKIANEAGLKVVDYKILTQPDCYNNYQYTIQATIENGEGEQSIEIGEANRSNLGSRGRQNPANMAQKRAYDRAVLKRLGIGVLSEEELQDDEELETPVNKLTLEEQKQIVPILNDIFKVKNKAQLTMISTLVKKHKDYSDAQLEVLRNLWKKKLAEIMTTF